MTTTLVIGLDAATWRVMDPLLETGELPTVESLIEDGTRAVLDSTIPPMTPAAWTSISTGVGPGKHGIFDFVDQDQDTYEFSTTEYETTTRPALWDVFAAEDLTVGVLNYPLVYPPRKVEDFFVSGIPASVEEVIAHPPDLQERLEAGDYRLHTEVGPGAGAEPYIRDVESLTDTQCDLAVDLLTEYKPDLFWTVFMGVDWVQHFCWDATVDGEPAVERIYRHFDSVIDRLVTATSDGANVILVSDHGACPIKAELHLNNLLAQWGYLERSDEVASPVRQIATGAASLAFDIATRLPPTVKKHLTMGLPRKMIDEVREAAGASQTTMHESIDWERTRAFSYGYMGRVFLHDAERYPEGAVVAQKYESLRDELIERFEQLEHPETGEPIVDRAVRSEDVYDGDRIDEGPDILLIPVDWRYMMYGDFGEQWIEPPGRRVADHHNEGILVLSGPKFDGGRFNADITDVAPTLLALHGLPLIDDMDGAVLSSAFADEVNESMERVPPEQLVTSSRRGSVRSGVEDRLENLGYM